MHRGTHVVRPNRSHISGYHFAGQSRASTSTDPFSPLQSSVYYVPTYGTNTLMPGQHIENSDGYPYPYPGSGKPRHREHMSNHELARRSGRAHHHDFDEHAGAEPGVNPRSGLSIAEYSHFKQDCVIDVIDYDSDEATFQRVTNAGLIQLLSEKKQDVFGDDGLPPRMVRWINIGGIDWSVLSAVALKYNLHSLALEDILHERGHNHSKVDYYPGHLFLRILCHTVDLDDESASPSSSPLNMSPDPSKTALSDGEIPPEPAKAASVRHLDLEGGPDVPPDNLTNGEDPQAMKGKDAAPGNEPRKSFLSSSLKKRLSALSGFSGPARQKQLLELRALKKGDRVMVKNEPMFIFLLHDGTVISMQPSPSLAYTAPITERLHRPDSILRTSEDASLLVESLLDLVVDRILEMVDEYQVKINKLEHDILLNPDMATVRNLHILSGDLILHKRTLDPIKTMIFGLRRYDLDRCVALADNMARDYQYAPSDSDTESSISDTVAPDNDEGREERKKAEGKDKKSKAKRKRQRERGRRQKEQGGVCVEIQAPETKSPTEGEKLRRKTSNKNRRKPKSPTSPTAQKIEGFFSFKAKVYLADVYDHMDFALDSLDMFAGISENLINYAFNVASYDMNMVMSRLTLVTIIFLPLTLLTGYFGMNFTPFWAVDHNSDLFFWKISLPVMAALIPLFMYKDIRKAVQYTKRVREVRRSLKGLR
ncbi:unnamed protein product [Cyclocybe aegerita]|uniref:Magnesium transporter n=1 Tax=Cyclocybe aegerita TaxID=1973307 RepID=A0A8S0XM27_CYCAE|nr:unnamed protein product [Cyclocybe aegerita]